MVGCDDRKVEKRIAIQAFNLYYPEFMPSALLLHFIADRFSLSDDLWKRKFSEHIFFGFSTCISDIEQCEYKQMKYVEKHFSNSRESFAVLYGNKWVCAFPYWLRITTIHMYVKTDISSS